MPEKESELLAGTWTYDDSTATVVEPNDDLEGQDDVTIVDIEPVADVEDAIEPDELVTVRKARGPRLVRNEGEFVTGQEYDVTAEVAQILLNLTSPHGQSYFERV